MFSNIALWITILLFLRTQVTAEVNLSADNSSHVLLTAQLGPYPVSINAYEIKTKRIDPLAPTHQLRNLMVTVYRPTSANFTCPTQNQVRIQYAPRVVLSALIGLLSLSANSTFNTDGATILERLQLLNCTSSSDSFSSSSQDPILLFSPGLRATQNVYASILMASASFGYTVLAIDHTYESAAVVFPDGSVNYTSPKTLSLIQEGHKGIATLQDIRTADAVSVLDAMKEGDIPGLEQSKNLMDQKQIAMFGHSLGGSTSANAALQDSRIKAAANLDGTFFGSPNRTTFHKPLLMLGYAGGWPKFYSTNDHGWKTWVQPNNTVHYSYTDLPLITDLLDLRNKTIPLSLTGTINSQRLQTILSTYILHFFNFVLRGESSHFLQGPRSNFPDVAFIGHSEPKD